MRRHGGVFGAGAQQGGQMEDRGHLVFAGKACQQTFVQDVADDDSAALVTQFFGWRAKIQSDDVALTLLGQGLNESVPHLAAGAGD